MTGIAPSDHRDGVIGWREAGQGRAVVFLHGLGGSRRAWGPQLAALAPRFRCLAWDLPGYGSSPALAEMTFPAIARAAVDWFDRLGLDTVDIVGLSFGGMHAQHIALTAPARVRRLVLVDTSPAFGLDGTTPEAWKAARLAPLDAGATPAEMAPQVLDAIVGRPLDPAIRDDLIAAFGDISSDALRAAVACLCTHDVRDRLPEIVAKTLVVVGALDTETPVAYAEALAGSIPRARLEVIPLAGHLTPSEDPATFNRLVGEFLDAEEPDHPTSPHPRSDP